MSALKNVFQAPHLFLFLFVFLTLQPLFAEKYEGLWNSFVEEGPHVTDIQGGGGMDGVFDVEMSINSNQVYEPCIVWAHTPGDGIYQIQSTELYFSKRDATSGKWSTPAKITDNDFEEENVQFVVTQGTPEIFHVFYTASNPDNSNDVIMYTSSANGSTWSTPVSIAEHFQIRYLTAKTSGDESFHLMYTPVETNYTTSVAYVWKAHYSGSQWSTPIVLANESGVNYSKPLFSLETTNVDDDIIHAVWHESKGEYSDRQERVVFKIFSEEGNLWTDINPGAVSDWETMSSFPSDILALGIPNEHYYVYVVKTAAAEGTSYWQPFLYTYSSYSDSWLAPQKITESNSAQGESFLLIPSSTTTTTITIAWMEKSSGMKVRLADKGEFVSSAQSVPDWSRPYEGLATGYLPVTGEYLKAANIGGDITFVWNVTSSWDSDKSPKLYTLQQWTEGEVKSLEELNDTGDTGNTGDSGNTGNSGSDKKDDDSCSILYL
ncbi:MAG TPA: sialidase family protein [bacterium]|nr:sialidase family protein [bacterium]HQJ60675.1 sialidase family protein [bacterium]